MTAGSVCCICVYTHTHLYILISISITLQRSKALSNTVSTALPADTQFCSPAGPNGTTMYSCTDNVQQQDRRTILYSTGLQNVCDGAQLATLTAHSCPRCWTYRVIILSDDCQLPLPVGSFIVLLQRMQQGRAGTRQMTVVSYNKWCCVVLCSAWRAVNASLRARYCLIGLTAPNVNIHTHNLHFWAAALTQHFHMHFLNKHSTSDMALTMNTTDF